MKGRRFNTQGHLTTIITPSVNTGDKPKDPVSAKIWTLKREIIHDGKLANKEILHNLSILSTILLVLENTDYATTTWRIKRQTFGSIYIPGWSKEKIEISSWLEGFGIVTESINKRIMSLDTSGRKRCKKDNARSNKEKANNEGNNGENETYSGEEFPRLILIPQCGKEILKRNKLLYKHLINDDSRTRIRDRLIDLLSV